MDIIADGSVTDKIFLRCLHLPRSINVRFGSLPIDKVIETRLAIFDNFATLAPSDALVPSRGISREGRFMPTRNINLTEHYDRFVTEQVGVGRFRNASEVMRAGLHLLEQQTIEERERIELLRALAAKGFEEIDQGRGIELRGEDALCEFIAGIGQRVEKQAKPRRRSG